MTEQKFLIVKRDLYDAVNHRGYTGIKELASRNTLEEVAMYMPNKYSPNQDDVYYIAEEDAPEFTNSCYEDLKEAHLQGKIAALQAEVAALRGLADTSIPMDLFSSTFEDCYINLTGLDYKAACQTDDGAVGDLGDGERVLLDLRDGRVRLNFKGLHILSENAATENKAKAVAKERERCAWVGQMKARERALYEINGAIVCHGEMTSREAMESADDVGFEVAAAIRAGEGE